MFYTCSRTPVVIYYRTAYYETTSFPVSLILPPPGASEGGGKMRDTGNEVDYESVMINMLCKAINLPGDPCYSIMSDGIC